MSAQLPAAVRVARVAWPAFLGACGMQVLVFAFVDPHDLHWAGQLLELPRQTVYAVGFFAFWAVCGVACALAALLAGNTSERAQAHVHAQQREHADQGE